jgi:hypothetical protein
MWPASAAALTSANAESKAMSSRWGRAVWSMGALGLPGRLE